MSCVSRAPTCCQLTRSLKSHSVQPANRRGLWCRDGRRVAVFHLDCAHVFSALAFQGGCVCAAEVQGEHERVSADLQLHRSGLLFQLQHAEIYKRGCIHIYVYICNGGGRGVCVCVYGGRCVMAK